VLTADKAIASWRASSRMIASRMKSDLLYEVGTTPRSRASRRTFSRRSSSDFSRRVVSVLGSEMGWAAIFGDMAARKKDLQRGRL
jgi:hypothetical protein